jgi:hypothetical protein
MKTYTQLTEAEQKAAFEKGFKETMSAIIESNGDLFPGLESEVDQAAVIAENNQTPWFFGEILYHEIAGAKEKIDAAIQDYIANALYPESGEYVINI